MMNDASRYKGSSMELKDEVISYIETISEIRDIDQLFAKFSSYSQGDQLYEVKTWLEVFGRGFR